VLNGHIHQVMQKVEGNVDKPPNPNVIGTLEEAIAKVKSLPRPPGSSYR
jgi:hypothetical protein